MKYTIKLLQCNVSSKCFHKESHFQIQKHIYLFFLNPCCLFSQAVSKSLRYCGGRRCLAGYLSTTGTVSGDFPILFFCRRPGWSFLKKEEFLVTVSLTLSRDHRALDGGHPVRLRIVGCSKFIVRVESTTPFILALDLRSLR